MFVTCKRNQQAVVPLTDKLMPCSVASRLARGDAITLPLELCTGGAAGGATGAAAGGGGGGGSVAGAVDGGVGRGLGAAGGAAGVAGSGDEGAAAASAEGV